MKYLSDEEAKCAIIDIGRKMYNRGLVSASDGNISIKVSDDEIWTTPSGVSKGFMTEDILVKTNLSGSVLCGQNPSSELKMHLQIYSQNLEIRAVVHAHPPASTALAAAGIALDRVFSQEMVLNLGTIPVAEYALPGSDTLAANAAKYCREYNGVLFEYHGAVSWGADITQAYFRMESIEQNAKIMMYMRTLGIDRPMSDEQINELIALRTEREASG